jgi:signal transduction histidine kinase
MDSVTPVTSITELDFVIARARIIVSLAALVSIYFDPGNGGFLGIEPHTLTILICHFTYGVVLYTLLRRGWTSNRLAIASVVLDVIFATLLALTTEQQPTSPAFVFFVFAILSAGYRFDLITCFNTALWSVALYLIVVLLTRGRLSNLYLVRAAYLAITAYVIGFFGDQRATLEARVRDLKSAEEREFIARELHDGYVQALAGVTLRLGACERLIEQSQYRRALDEVKEIRLAVGRQYDEVRQYIRSLARAKHRSNGMIRENGATVVKVYADITSHPAIVDHVLSIVLEAMRNSLRHGRAGLVSADVRTSRDSLLISIDDDGVGLGLGEVAPWSIASRVREMGGSLTMSNSAGVGARLRIELPLV